MTAVRWAFGTVRHRLGNALAVGACLAAVVALLASLGCFLTASKQQMTDRAVSDVAVDWIVEAAVGADPAAIDDAIGAAAGIGATVPVEVASVPGLEATTTDPQGTTTQTTGRGVVLGLGDGYRSAMPQVVRDLAGASDGILVYQQTAANLHVGVGDEVRIGREGLPPVSVRIAGIVDLPTADSLFQTVGAPAGAQPQAPPDNVMLVPAARWHELFDAMAAARADTVRHQVHVQLSRHLPSDPAAAASSVHGRARNLELALHGQALVGDILGAQLDAARSDALYAQILFLFLGLPGAAVAALLGVIVAGSGSDRRRRDEALLRARGAPVSTIVRLAAAEGALVGLGAAAVGLAVAALIGRFQLGTASFGASPLAAVGWAGAAALTGPALAIGTVVIPARRRAIDATVADSRRAIERLARPPAWARLRLDLLLLVAAGAVWWSTSQNGYKLVLAPEGIASVSVDYWAFAGPALAWIGSGLLVVRIARLLLDRGSRAVAAAVRPMAGPASEAVAATLHRHRKTLARNTALVAVAFGFAASTAVFDATYRQQAEVDAVLSNGADVRVESPTTSGRPDGVAEDRILAVPGTRGVETLLHRTAYVGSDLQDIYGVDPATVGRVTPLQDGWFLGGTAAELLARLRRTPDGVLVSAETVSDFRLSVGDRLVLRLQVAPSHEYRDIPFTYVGIAREFPTAPHDSFLVANRAYVGERTGTPTPDIALVDTGDHSAAVAARLRTALGPTFAVTDIADARRSIGSSLTSVELAGLTGFELVFAGGLVVAAVGAVLALGVAERRRSLAIVSALGADRRQLAAFVTSEATFVAVVGTACGAVVAVVLSRLLVATLTGVFDPAPSHLAVPIGYLVAVLVGSALSLALVVMVAVRSSSRELPVALREL